MSSPTPFTVDISQTVLDRISDRVRAYDWHEMPEGGAWEYGANLDYMMELCAYWLSDFDWRQAEDRLNRFPQFKARVDDLDIHFIHEKGSGSNPKPIIITHGWPGSVFEFMDVIEPLAHPERFGGDPEDGLDVIVPSLPGYGFSGKPKRPIGPADVARYFDKLMRDVLGYDGYIAQGGDWGSIISGHLGSLHSPKDGGACKAVHVNLLLLTPEAAMPETDEERAWFAEREAGNFELSGYSHMHMTRPQTLSYAMMDSPVGAAAWIVEKFYAWSDLDNNDIESVYTKDQLLANVMIYLVTRTFNTATWLYRGAYEAGGFWTGRRVEVPTGYAAFPRDISPPPPRSLAEKAYNLVHWTTPERGGHFAAMEKPEVFVADVCTFARKLTDI